MTEDANSPKLKKFRSRIEMRIYARLSALEIAKHLKIGFWLDERDEYIKSDQCMPNLIVTDLEISLNAPGELPQEYAVRIDFTFESDRSEEYLQGKLVVFFGENSSSLAGAAADSEAIETADYTLFELFRDE